MIITKLDGTCSPAVLTDAEAKVRQLNDGTGRVCFGDPTTGLAVILTPRELAAAGYGIDGCSHPLNVLRDLVGAMPAPRTRKLTRPWAKALQLVNGT